ncbi:MAG: phage holin family protein [Bacilli bacterium]|nr:phage holin family protein [Bacilli bacterium]
MHLSNKDTKKIRAIKFIDWLLYMVGYTLVFIFVTSFFKSIYIDIHNTIIWSIIIVLVTYILNKTIKPILVTLTIPITGITLGLFYPCINVFILKLTDWILGSHFEVKNLYIALFVAIFISITNFIMERIIEKIIIKVKSHG